MLEIDFTQEFYDLDGETPIALRIDRRCEECGQATEQANYTLRLACTRALVSQSPNESLKPEEHVRRYNLAMKIYNNDLLALTAKDISLIQDLAAKMYSPLVAAQVYLKLDPSEEKEGQ